MEDFKLFQEILEPDPRQKFWGVMTAQGAFRSLTLEDFHETAKAIELHEGVPEDIRNHFQTARHLQIYSFFCYPFHVSAMMHAYASAEFALKLKAGTPEGGFKRLLKTGVREGWIRDDGFKVVQWQKERLESDTELDSETEGSPALKGYCEILYDSLPFLRNELMHGASFLHNSSATTLQICADLINQLFPTPAKKS